MEIKKEMTAFHLLAQMKGSHFKNTLIVVYPITMKISNINATQQCVKQ